MGIEQPIWLKEALLDGGSPIALLRAHTGLPSSLVAQQAGIAPERLRGLENESWAPTEDEMDRLASVLDAAPGWLVAPQDDSDDFGADEVPWDDVEE